MAKRETKAGTKRGTGRVKARQVGAVTTQSSAAPQRDAVTGALVGGHQYQVQRDSVTGAETLVPVTPGPAAPRAVRANARKKK